ncbi:MAG: hypothetical protein WBZ36_29120 [Candidatus Nitrosopolaris sp.]
MNRTACFSVLVRITALIFIIGVLAIVSIQDTLAAIGGMTGGNSSQGIANTTNGAGQHKILQAPFPCKICMPKSLDQKYISV